MQKSVLMSSTSIAWIMAVVYDRIEAATGTKLSVLLWAAILTISIGLYAGLIRNNEDKLKEES